MKKWQVFSILVLLFLITWAIRAYSDNFATKDTGEYLRTAEMIKSGAWFQPVSNASEALKLTKRPFLYPIWLLASGPAADYIISLLQIIFFAFSIYLMLKLFTSMKGEKFGLIAALCILTPSIFIYSEMIMSEAIVMPLITSLVYVCFYKDVKNRFLKVQLILLLLVFTKPVFYPIIFFNFIYWFIVFLRDRKLIYSTSLIPVVLVLLYMGFNQYRTGYFHFSSISTINLVNYNLYLFELKQKGFEASEHYNDSLHAEADKITEFSDKELFLRKNALERIEANLPKYTVFHIWGSIRGMLDPGRFDLMTFSTSDYNDRVGFLNEINKNGFVVTLKNNLNNSQLWLYVFLGIILLGLLFKWILSVYLAYNCARNINVFSLYFILLAAAVIVITGPLNASRFMMPFQPVLIVFSVKGFELFLQKRKKARSIKEG